MKIVTLAMLANLIMPPPEYDYTPKYIPPITEFSESMIGPACGVNFRIAGCYIRGKIFLLDNMTPEARQKVLRHEYGHVNGWKHK